LVKSGGGPGLASRPPQRFCRHQQLSPPPYQSGTRSQTVGGSFERLVDGRRLESGSQRTNCCFLFRSVVSTGSRIVRIRLPLFQLLSLAREEGGGGEERRLRVRCFGDLLKRNKRSLRMGKHQSLANVSFNNVLAPASFGPTYMENFGGSNLIMMCVCVRVRGTVWPI
jgi:hypothetical protein